jgi:hypothetical protein
VLGTPGRDLAQRQPETADAPDARVPRARGNRQTSGSLTGGLSTMTDLEIILGLFFIVIVASSLHPALRIVLATLVAVLLLIVAVVFHSDDEVHR